MGQSLVSTTLLLCLLSHGTDMAIGWDDRDFFSYCPPSQCSKDGPEIRFPLRLPSDSRAPSSCGSTTCINLACSGQDTILRHPFLGPSKVTAIDYKLGLVRIIPLADRSSECPVSNLSLPVHVDNNCGLYANDPGRLVGCSREFTPHDLTPHPILCENCYDWDRTGVPAADLIAGPIHCLSNSGRFIYLVHPYLSMSLLQLDCKAVSNSAIPIFFTSRPAVFTYKDTSTFKQRAEATISFSEITVSWMTRFGDGYSPYYNCSACERRGRRCAFSSQRNLTFCMPGPNGSRVKVIAATSTVACFIVLSLVVVTALYFSLKWKYNEEVHLKVETFLQIYRMSKPTRYSFSEVKKIARRFKERVGQGGFGSVYRGELPNGVPVAVKMLENCTGEREEFINEVATIGKVHHTNIVRLLGFSSEGTRRALIYEFMPNNSLDKYIFSNGFNESQEFLRPNKMLDIALGVARGMEYLHQGCNQRILHFDIKPHNILLDYNFIPKISDFGLAKLCARDQSIITLTAARGTMGYSAPEMYSPNFGGISYKSDVYSFGMLVLEMVSGRRNLDPGIENQNDVYLPQLIYERVIAGQDMVLAREIADKEKETMRLLAIVALWCIQWNPKNRPSMTEVVNMLTGRSQNLQVPPKPYVV